jgi:biotin transport system substrate-specific component
MRVSIVDNGGFNPMEIDMYVNRYKNARFNFFKWRYELDFVYKLSLALTFALLTGLLAQIRFYLPGTPVPVTGQVFGVILAGVLLGKWGGVSQCMYLGLGVMGVPWFAGLTGGLAYIAGPTGGYLVGFILAAFFIGFIVDRYIRSRNFLPMFGLMLLSTFVIIYVPGIIHLYFWMGASINFWELLTMAVIPFIAADIIKSLIAAGIANGITPKKSYANEVDALI